MAADIALLIMNGGSLIESTCVVIIDEVIRIQLARVVSIGNEKLCYRMFTSPYF